MSIPDPQAARDFARRAILSSAEDVDFMGIAEQFSDDERWPADEDDAEAMHDAIEAERQTATVTVSWPDEQQPADPVTAEQQQDEAAGRVERFLDAREARGDARNGGTISVIHADGSRTGEGPGMYRRPLTDADLRAVLAARDALAMRIAELEAHPLIVIEPDAELTHELRRQFAALMNPCPCGCQFGQPCGCGLEDCECVGDCPVCDVATAEES